MGGRPEQATFTAPAAGSYLFCVWLAPDPFTVVTRRTKVRRGRVVRLSPKPGTRLRRGAAVGVVVSRR